MRITTIKRWDQLRKTLGPFGEMVLPDVDERELMSILSCEFHMTAAAADLLSAGLHEALDCRDGTSAVLACGKMHHNGAAGVRS